MPGSISFNRSARRSLIVACAFLIAHSSFVHIRAQTVTTNATPSAAVSAFYAALREKRFREAFMMSVYRPAVENLSDGELSDLRPDFEKIAANVPEKIDITGEQISGDTATVFLKLGEQDGKPNIQLVPMRRDEKGAWTIDDPSLREAIKHDGKNFFFNQRIAAHHDDAKEMLARIAKAELAYALQHNGTYTDMKTLVDAELLPKDITTPESTGYLYHINLSKDGKSYTAGAEPEKYGRTGKLSFYLDPKTAKSKDTNGKPYKP